MIYSPKENGDNTEGWRGDVNDVKSSTPQQVSSRFSPRKEKRCLRFVIQRLTPLLESLFHNQQILLTLQENHSVVLRWSFLGVVFLCRIFSSLNTVITKNMELVTHNYLNLFDDYYFRCSSHK